MSGITVEEPPLPPAAAVVAPHVEVRIASTRTAGTSSAPSPFAQESQQEMQRKLSAAFDVNSERPGSFSINDAVLTEGMLSEAEEGDAGKMRRTSGGLTSGVGMEARRKVECVQQEPIEEGSEMPCSTSSQSQLSMGGEMLLSPPQRPSFIIRALARLGSGRLVQDVQSMSGGSGVADIDRKP